MRLRMMALMVASGIGALALSACTGEKGDTIVNTPGSTTTGITVTGEGEAFGPPDLVNLQMGVQAEGATVAAARETAASTAQAVIDSVKKNGVDAKDVQTARFDVTPLYDSSRNGLQVIRAYRVTNVLSVNIRKVDSAGKIIDDAVTAGGNNAVVQGIYFTIDDSEKLREAAREDAMKEARAKAEQLAKHAGVKAGKPISIAEGGGSIPYNVGADAAFARAAADTPTPVEAGQLQVRVSVTVLYAIE